MLMALNLGVLGYCAEFQRVECQVPKILRRRVQTSKEHSEQFPVEYDLRVDAKLQGVAKLMHHEQIVCHTFDASFADPNDGLNPWLDD